MRCPASIHELLAKKNPILAIGYQSQNNNKKYCCGQRLIPMCWIVDAIATLWWQEENPWACQRSQRACSFGDKRRFISLWLCISFSGWQREGNPLLAHDCRNKYNLVISVGKRKPLSFIKCNGHWSASWFKKGILILKLPAGLWWSRLLRVHQFTSISHYHFFDSNLLPVIDLGLAHRAGPKDVSWKTFL